MTVLAPHVRSVRGLERPPEGVYVALLDGARHGANTDRGISCHRRSRRCLKFTIRLRELAQSHQLSAVVVSSSKT